MSARPTPPLAVGIVGCGTVATGHAAAYHALKHEGVHIAALADAKIDRARSFAELHAPGTPVFPDLTTLLNATQVDAISVCTPNAFHHPITLEALAAGVHVLCEKPPGITVKEALDMEQAALKAGRVLTYGLLHRHRTAGLHHLTAELGHVYHADARWLRRRGWPPWLASASRAAHGGGAMVDIGVHVLDLAWYLMGCPEPLLVAARGWQHKTRVSTVGLPAAWASPAFDVEDHSHAVIDFASARLVVEAAFAVDMPDDELARVELQGDQGRLSWRLMTAQETPDATCAPQLFTEQDGTLRVTTVVAPPPVTSRDAFLLEIEHFVGACRGHQTPLVTAAQGVVVQRLLDAITESTLRGGAQVTLIPEGAAAGPPPAAISLSSAQQPPRPLQPPRGRPAVAPPPV